MDPFKILGISRDATASEIESAYRKKALKHHPDAGGDAWAFQQVQQAYETIRRSRSAGNRPPGTSQPKPPRPQAKRAGTPKSSKSASSSKQASQERPNANASGKKTNHWLRHLLTGELPLQNETTTFILVGVLDIFMTYMLLRFGAVEANPIANFFLARWGFNGMIAFKMLSIASVSVIAQVIAQFQMTTARKLLIYGTAIVGVVVIYSTILLARELR